MNCRQFTGDRLLIASHNRGKVEEIVALLAPFSIQAVSAASLGIPEPDETGDSFEANAALKAQAAAEASGLPALSDDSGLVVPALGGAPATFVAVLALAWPDGGIELFRGDVAGTLTWPPRGDRGFGYDPMFVPRSRIETFGEMNPAEKHKISHRARAFAELVDGCFNGR